MKGIQQEISAARMAISNALNVPEILSNMLAYGYNAKKLQEGKTLVEKFSMLHMLKKDKYDERQHISITMKADIKACRQLYMEHVKVARQAFSKESGIQRQLEIDRAIPKVLTQWLPLAYTFYIKLQEVHSQMTRFVIPAEEVSQGKAMVESILSLREARFIKKGEAEATTQSRDVVKREMRSWLKDFYSIARIALKNNPQWLEALGIQVTSQVK